jgi:uncharacterized protein YqgV (UPF0045/DUF77 family)
MFLKGGGESEGHNKWESMMTVLVGSWEEVTELVHEGQQMIR